MQSQSQSQHPSPSFRRASPPARAATPSTALALEERLQDAARRHDFSLAAVQSMWDAVMHGRGGMAQFFHAEFGGNGQWMRGGMTMVGDMFNRSLSTRVAALAEELAQLRDDHPEFVPAADLAHGGGMPGDKVGSGAQGVGIVSAEWWPAGLASPSTSGAQNGIRYAWFPAERRLAIERNGVVELYDTQDHRIGGVSQQQGTSGTLRFTSQHGPIDLASLARVPGQDKPRSPAASSPTAEPGSPTPEGTVPTMPAAGMPPACRPHRRPTCRHPVQRNPAARTTTCSTPSTGWRNCTSAAF